MISFLSAIVGLAVSIFATPWGQAWAARYMRRVKQERALARLKAIPEYHVGVRLEFYSPDVGGGSARVGDTWRLAEMGVGRILLVDKNRMLAMTCQEFEAGTAIVLDAVAA